MTVHIHGNFIVLPPLGKPGRQHHDTEPFPILIMSSAWLQSDQNQFLRHWLNWTRFGFLGLQNREMGALLIRPSRHYRTEKWAFYHTKTGNISYHIVIPYNLSIERERDYKGSTTSVFEQLTFWTNRFRNTLFILNKRSAVSKHIFSFRITISESSIPNERENRNTPKCWRMGKSKFSIIQCSYEGR